MLCKLRDKRDICMSATNDSGLRGRHRANNTSPPRDRQPVCAVCFGRYNRRMAGVDRLDQIRCVPTMVLGDLFWGILVIGLINAYVLLRHDSSR